MGTSIGNTCFWLRNCTCIFREPRNVLFNQKFKNLLIFNTREGSLSFFCLTSGNPVPSLSQTLVQVPSRIHRCFEAGRGLVANRV